MELPQNIAQKCALIGLQKPFQSAFLFLGRLSAQIAIAAVFCDSPLSCVLEQIKSTGFQPFVLLLGSRISCRALSVMAAGCLLSPDSQSLSGLKKTPAKPQQ